MALVLRQSTVVDVLIGPFVDSTDGVTAETGLTISQGDVLLSKNGQALTQKNDNTAAAHDANGYYNCELDATDTNTVGTLVLTVAESGALPVRHEFQVIEEAAYDAIYAASAPGPLAANTTGSGLTAIPWNSSWDAEVQSECTDALNAYDPPTNAEMEARTLASASYATATALQTVDDEVGAIDTVVDAIKAVTDNLPDSGALSSLATASALSTVDGNVDAIKAQTDQLSFDAGGGVDANITHVIGDAVQENGATDTNWGGATA